MDLVVELLKSGDYWIAIVVVIVTIAINAPRVTEYYFLLRKNRMAQILSALQEPSVSEELKTHLKNELDIECFKGIHGIRISLPMLKVVYVLNERVGATVSFRIVTGFEPSLLISGVIFLSLGFYMLNDGSTLFSVYHINRALNDYEKATEKKSL
ncbi:hypothetical protein QNS37_004515 [Vibrio parahaemolyticus]|nr:hypothetical protein [Vibrio parahaemolyticus]EJG1679201.1 hypothetical protein [Vibrio parahaemolyticus]EJG1721883.1 hypothetical protein [Vibrio parahaemolyticus]EJG1763462.1 hypothetical protein [Vibrio parahaemolyticus]ELB2017075.1 hypothetical protein [Vibrio parahaemolyticus]